MTRVSLVVVMALAGGALAPLAAQKAPPAAAVRPRTQPVAPAGKTLQPPGAAARPAAPAAAPTTPAAGQGGQAAPAVTPQAARPPSTASTFTAGLAVQDFAGGGPDSALEYGTRFGRMLDSAIVSLVDVFRNTSGQPIYGAGSPSALSQRERDRWSRCRNLYWDLTTYAGAVQALIPSLPADADVRQAAQALDSSLAAIAATSSPVAECDNVASMIAGPDRWTPWQDQYEAAARHFYQDFYAQIRGAHERDRAFVNAVNAVLTPGRRVSVPPGLPPNPPYAGAGPGE